MKCKYVCKLLHLWKNKWLNVWMKTFEWGLVKILKSSDTRFDLLRSRLRALVYPERATAGCRSAWGGGGGGDATKQIPYWICPPSFPFAANTKTSKTKAVRRNTADENKATFNPKGLAWLFFGFSLCVCDCLLWCQHASVEVTTALQWSPIW